MKIKPEALVAYIFGILATLCATILSATGHGVPPELWTIAGAGIAGGVGLANPFQAMTTSSASSAPARDAPAPASAASEPVTKVVAQ